MLKALLDKNLVTFSPCGVAFVKKRVREGVLPRMLSEILNTRLMVKKSMKLHKDNSVLQRVLHSRQLGLKLIANVTYGYTAANFSGRMPCVEIGDSVVAKGRETLERAIKLVEGTERWGAKVVYGDTDSLFVLCPGRSREAAFKIGEEIAEAEGLVQWLRKATTLIVLICPPPTYHEDVRIGGLKGEGCRSPSTDGGFARWDSVRFRQRDQLDVAIQMERLVDTENGNIVGPNATLVVLVHVHLGDATTLYSCIVLAEVVLAGNGLREAIGRNRTRYAVASSQHELFSDQRTKDSQNRSS